MRELKVSTQAEKQIVKLARKNPDIAKKLVVVIENLRENPYPKQSNVKKLKNSPYHSARMGDYRVIYSFTDDAG